MNDVSKGDIAGTRSDDGLSAAGANHPSATGSAERAQAAGATSPAPDTSLPPVGPRTALPRAWRIALAALAGVLLALLAVFWDTAWSLVSTWYSSDYYGHGFLVLPAVGYLLWCRLPVLIQAPPRPSPWALALFAVPVVGWLLGYVMGVLLVQQVALVMILQSAFLVLWGREATRAVAFPLFYLFFAVPFGSFLVPPLQDFTAVFVVQFLVWTGVPVYSDGWVIEIPAASFFVAEACAGVRFLISSTAIGFLGAYLFYRQLWRRALFVGLSIVIPIIANGFRGYGIVMLGHLFGREAAVGTDHIVYGFVFLTIVMACLLGLGLTFREHAAPGAEGQVGLGVLSPAPEPGRAARLSAGLALLGLIAVALVGRLYGDHIMRPEPGPAVVELSPPILPSPWVPVSAGSADWRPRFPGHRAELLQTFSDGARTVSLHIAYYDPQRQGAEVVSSTNKFSGADGRAWRDKARTPGALVPSGIPLEVRVRRMGLGGKRVLVWSWYWVDGQFTSSRYVAKLLEVKAKLLGGESAAAAISVATRGGGPAGEAEATLRSFVQNVDSLRRVLEDAAGQGSK
jgi:exosortase A